MRDYMNEHFQRDVKTDEMLKAAFESVVRNFNRCSSTWAKNCKKATLQDYMGMATSWIRRTFSNYTTWRDIRDCFWNAKPFVHLDADMHISMITYDSYYRGNDTQNRNMEKLNALLRSINYSDLKYSDPESGSYTVDTALRFFDLSSLEQYKFTTEKITQ